MLYKISFAFFILSIVASGCSFSLAGDVTPPPGFQDQSIAAEESQPTSGPLFPIVPPDPSAGKVIYSDKCAPCHGNTGLGDGPKAQDLPNPSTAIGSDEVARNAQPAAWYKVVSNGNLERFMPPFGNLTDRQRWDVVAYALSLSMSEQSIENGQEIFQKYCLECHGVKGKGDGPKSMGLQLPDFTRQEYMVSKSDADFFQATSEGISPDMPAFGNRLSENDRWDVSRYIRSFSFVGLKPTTAKKTPETPAPVASLQPVPQTTVNPEQTEPEGIIHGMVINRSGDNPPAHAEVLLHGFDQMQLVITQTTPLDGDGTFVFNQVELKPGRKFFSTIEYDGVIYGSDFVTIEDPSVPIQLAIDVFESTTDSSILIVDRLHYFFEFLDENAIRVAELYIISNPTNKTLIAGETGQPVVKFSLPKDATDLEFQEGSLGGRFILTEDGFADTSPVQPGEGVYQVLFSYVMPYENKLELTHRMTMKTKAIVILVPEDTIKIKGNGIEDGGTRNVQGVLYHMFNGGPFKRGDVLRLKVTGQPDMITSKLKLTTKRSLLIGAGALGIVLLIVGAWLFQRKRSENSISDPALFSEKIEYDDSEAVMDAILALDDLFQEGKLSEDAYQERRAELKERLMQINQKHG